MMFHHLLSWAALLGASGPLLGHPITDSAEMPYAGPASLEDRGSLDAMDPSFPLQDGYFYSTLLSGETSRDGIRTSGLLPRGMTKEVLQENQSLLNPFSHVLGIQKQFRKRGGNGTPPIRPSPAAYPRNKNSVCFWKYCV